MASGIRTRTSGIMIPAYVALAATGYQGPGDVVGSAFAWYGLRAYNAAYATGSNPAIDVCDPADVATTATINILATGALDEASLNTFFAAHGGATIIKYYDQTGNGRHLLAFDGLEASGMTVVQNGAGTHSTASTTTASHPNAQLLTAASFTQAQPFVFMGFVKRVERFTSFVEPLGQVTANVACGWNNVADEAMTFAGTVLTRTATDNTWIAMGNLFSGVNSQIAIDGAATTGDANTTGFTGNQIVMPRNSLIGFQLTEIGMWLGDQSASFAAISTQQHAYWGV